MDLFQLTVLAFIQGLTEFLPVSSSGHLVLLPRLTGWPDQGIMLDVATHVGTLLAIVCYYRRDIFAMVVAVLRWNNPDTRPMRNLALLIVLGSVPAVLAGAAIHHFFPDGIRSVGVIIFTTLFFGALMGIADRKGAEERAVETVNWRTALYIGFAQALALIPGTSRSGVTMTAARFIGFKRTEAARFSFLLGLPAMAGAGFLNFLEMLDAGAGDLWRDAGVVVVLAFVFGLGAIHVMIRWLGRAGLMPFVVYRMILGVVLLVLWRQGFFA